MLSRLYPFIKNSHRVSSSKMMTKNTLVPYKKEYAIYHIDKPTVKNSTHEQTQSNPILQTSKGKVFQHPSIGKDICEAKYCEDKVCEEPCEKIIEKTTIAHGTHDGSREDAQFVSTTDFAGESHPQYAVFYKEPQKMDPCMGQEIDVDKTKEMRDNTEMQDNIHMKSSRLPSKPENTGSNDPQNIN